MGDREITRDGLLASAENESTYFIDFNSKCRDFGDAAVYCLVENYDLCFYPHRVSDILGRKATGVPCEGKKNVIALYTLIKSKPEYDRYTLRCFVDADFDDNSTLDSHIYVTTCYSIENLYMADEVVSQILENEYKIRPNSTDGKHQKCMNLYHKELSDFHQAVLLYNAWYREEKKKGLTKEMKVCLGENVPEAMIDLTIGAIVKHYDKAFLEGKFPLAHKLTDEEIESSRVVLAADMTKLRGKFEIQFLHKFFEYLNVDSSSHRREYTVLTKGVNMDRSHMISHLDHYVATPVNMREYIINGVRSVA